MTSAATGSRPRDLTDYREGQREQERTSAILRLVPTQGSTALDLGARDGHLSRLLAERFDHVVAVDLVSPRIDHPRIACIAANGTNLPFPDRTFDFALCAEVLEHIPSPSLGVVCRELVRVTRGPLLIGVPFRQDLRVGRSTCQSCGRKNPPWGHVNSFDLGTVRGLFPTRKVSLADYVGTADGVTNALSSRLMDYAGNPFGTYDQQEPCVHCGSEIGRPASRTPLQRVATRAAHILNMLQNRLADARPMWMHVLLS